jgi:formylglycine-generating enzyme required for sulfatase activity
MLGNVWEWVEDCYDNKYYAKSPLVDPTGPPSGRYRVVRGGSWFDGSRYVRSSNRYGDVPDVKDGLLGFRCAWEALP